MTRCAFVIPGDITLPTGGYGYDRQILARLGQNGITVSHVALPGSFPAPTKADMTRTETLLAATPADGILLIDGLALGAIPVDLMRRVQRRVVALVHHPLYLEAGLSEARSKELFASERDVLADAAHVVVTSPTTKTLVARHLGVPAERITVAEPGTERAARARGTGTPLALLAVGAVVPRKGYHVLVEALAGLANADWRLSIAGPDDRSPQTTEQVRALIAKKELEPRIRMLGAVDQAALAALYDAADVFVMPSLFEGYGMVLAEAMSRGLPIVCTTGGAAAETAPAAAAIKVPPGQAEALETALRQVLNNPALRARMAEASWTAGQKLPQWDDTARIIADVIKGLAT